MEQIPFLNIQYLFYVVYCYTIGECRPGTGTSLETLRQFWDIYTVLATLAALLLATGIVYCIIRINQLMALDKERLVASQKRKRGGAPATASDTWNEIERLVSSESPSEWRHAIIEADIILDQLLTKAGYVGATVGDKLKQIEGGELLRINEAWEAHKVRNNVAHRGTDYILTKREARRVIELYRAVFEDFFSI